LLAEAEAQGVELVGRNGLLRQLTKNVLETALDAEMTEHLGYEKQIRSGAGAEATPAMARDPRRCSPRSAGRDRGVARDQQQLRAADGQEAPRSADRHRCNRIVLDRNGFDYRRDFGALRRRLRQQTLQLITAAEAAVNNVWPR
jgi:hypothetical protein